MIEFSIVPPDFKEKDPRGLAMLFPNAIRNDNQSFIGFIKKMQVFDFYNSLSMFEEYAHANGFLLLPASIMHWRRRNVLGVERRVRVGRNAFYLVRENEMTEREKDMLLNHIKDVRRERI